MNLLSDNLKAFMKVCETGTVLEASHEMHLTQTAITQRIRSLENHVGTTLFIRSRKGMLPTKDGQELLLYCKQTLRLENELLSFRKDEQHQHEAELKFCGPTSTLRSIVVPKIIPLLKEHKNISLDVIYDDFENRIQKLKSGEVDFAIVRTKDTPNELKSKKITTDHFYLIGPTSWKNRKIEDIIKTERSIDFDQRDDMTINYLKKHGLYKHYSGRRHTINNLSSLVELVENGLGYGILEEKFIEQFTTKNKIIVLNNRKYVDNEASLCWMPRPIYPSLFLKVIDILTS